MVVDWTQESILAMAWLVVVMSFGAVTLLYVLIRRGAASKVASLFYLVPPVVAIETYFLFGETLTRVGVGRYGGGDAGGRIGDARLILHMRDSLVPAAGVPGFRSPKGNFLAVRLRLIDVAAVFFRYQERRQAVLDGYHRAPLRVFLGVSGKLRQIRGLVFGLDRGGITQRNRLSDQGC